MPPSMRSRRSPGEKPLRAASSTGTKWCWKSMIIGSLRRSPAWRNPARGISVSFRADHDVHEGRTPLVLDHAQGAPQRGRDERGVLDGTVAVRAEGSGHPGEIDGWILDPD